MRQSRLREQRTGRRRQVSKVRLEHASEAWEAQRCQPRRRHRRLHGGQGTQEVAGPTAMPHVSHGQVANPYGGVTLCSVEMPGGFCPAAFQTRVSRQLRSMRSWAHGAAPGTVAERGIWSSAFRNCHGIFCRFFQRVLSACNVVENTLLISPCWCWRHHSTAGSKGGGAGIWRC